MLLHGFLCDSGGDVTSGVAVGKTPRPSAPEAPITTVLYAPFRPRAPHPPATGVTPVSSRSSIVCRDSEPCFPRRGDRLFPQPAKPGLHLVA